MAAGQIPAEDNLLIVVDQFEEFSASALAGTILQKMKRLLSSSC